MHNPIFKILKTTIYIALVGVALIGCTVGGDGPEDDGSEGGVIGSGLILEGTVTDVRTFASNTLLIKSRTGEVSRAVIGEEGKYRAPNVSGSPPYLLRADLGNAEFRYGIAFDNELANVHSYTDVIMRNWFESGNGNIDVEFEQQTLTTTLPSRNQFEETADVFFSLVELVLETYELTGSQLLTGDYDSRNNNDGIDGYLRKNSIFIQDDKIALVITDPITTNQSTTRSSFSVFELATDTDIKPPEEPSSVRALPSASNEIVVVWEPATDNRGVVAYDVYREQELIATTPYPVFIDTGLEPDLLYTYEVVSIDASNNRSATSMLATSGTLGEPDTAAPPAPVQLSVTPQIGRMELLWGQSNISDVVAFDLYRGGDGGPLDFLTTVSGSIHSDVTVSSGIDYCYQIVALDAAGNESTKSTEMCEISIGSVIARANSEPVAAVPLLAGLSIPDIEDLVCEEQWDFYDIDSSVSVDVGCYLVNESIDVNNGGYLQLSPGTVLKFGAGTGLYVSEGGAFSSEGTDTQPVVMTAQDPTPGYWEGVDFYNSNSTRNKIVNSVIEYGAGGDHAASVGIRTDTSGTSRVSISGAVIRSCNGVGVLVSGNGANLAKLDGSVITECAAPLTIRIGGLDGVTQRNSFMRNANDWIDLGAADVRDDMRLDDLGVPYVMSSLVVYSGNLSIGAGVVLEFREGGFLSLFGSLTTFGAVENKVQFKGTLNEPGHWRGIRVHGHARFLHAELQYSGLPWPDHVEASLIVDSGIAELDNLSINNSISYAVLQTAGELRNVQNLTLTNNQHLISMPIQHISQLGESVFIEGNVNSKIELTGRTVFNGNIDIYDLGVSYLLQNSVNIYNGHITLHAGVRLDMQSAVEIQIGSSAAFRALGSASDPIILSSILDIPGAWLGLRFSSSSTLNSLTNVQLNYAGGGSNQGDAAIEFDCDSEGALLIENSTIQDSAKWGISVNSSTDCGLQLGANVSFIRNGSGDIFIPQ